MFKNFIFLFFTFIIYSFVGWVIEMFMENIVNRKFVNRGFLIGPYCPIYGFASIAMLVLLKPYKNDIVVLFCVSAVVCTVLEYFTSYLLEKMFKARWWDYTGQSFNVNGRVCLINSIMFGILGVLLIVFIDPFIQGIMLNINVTFLIIMFFSIFILFAIDIVISFNIISKIRFNLPNIKKDYTKEISILVKEKITDMGFFSRRLLEAFPNIKFLNNKKK